MKLHVYTIRDSKADTHNNPFFMVNEATALRSCAALLDREDVMRRHPEDFMLFYHGTYDDHTAKFDLLQQPQAIIQFVNLTGDMFDEVPNS